MALPYAALKESERKSAATGKVGGEVNLKWRLYYCRSRLQLISYACSEQTKMAPFCPRWGAEDESGLCQTKNDRRASMRV